ncbi:FtsX-like permease family protein [Bacillus salipaludis]|uniref:ABC transporter permease n=1 Tax=Bacillus salipaludis TaxID=2547811 RepID=A0A4R5VVU1_9BACI|nr:ABC transporter permease [Bacillus salipaludis]MDQ6597304.1 ABC transporter permease [Bacillus salipaludis]TDK63256.1 FtsX-like permease family protein [Bacillus salipaludis]
MSIYQSIKMALRSIKSNKLRSILTMLGIIIGVSSVIILVSIAQGSAKNVTSSINQLGTNLLTINTFGTDLSLTEDKIDQLTKLNGVKAISPVVSGRVNVKKDRINSQVSLTATNATYSSVRDAKVTQGRFINDLDIEYRQKIAVIGSETASTFFGVDNPIGQYIQVDGTSFKVVGVLASKGSSLGQSGDNVIIVPLSTGQRLVKSTSINQVYLQGKSQDQMDFVMNEVERKMASLYPNKSDSYSVTNQQDVMDTLSSVSNTMTMMLGGIASISLLVGGIGIMNIMLVSVSERTKEIGIRKAIGAKRRDVLLQFLIEAVVLSSMGGIIGILAGIGFGKIIASLMNLTIAYSTSVIVLSFIFSLLVGVVFGVFPANKASKLSPIQALRYE